MNGFRWPIQWEQQISAAALPAPQDVREPTDSYIGKPFRAVGRGNTSTILMIKPLSFSGRPGCADRL